MRTIYRCIFVLLMVSAVAGVACSKTTAEDSGDEAEPAVLEPIEGTELNRIILTEQAAQRLGLEMAAVGEAELSGGDSAEPSLRNFIPYSAVLYDANGNAFVYTSPEPLTFVRAPISVDYIEGDRVVLMDGPVVGTSVVTVGAAELFGSEFDFKEE